MGNANMSIDDLDRRSCGIIFGAKRNYRATTMQHIANELESGSTHDAVRIDAQRDVVNALAAMQGLRDHQLFVFGPVEAGKKLRLAGKRFLR